jgi:Right handed beta helix region/Ricin-type beta-trefoil lectin domain-like
LLRIQHLLAVTPAAPNQEFVMTASMILFSRAQMALLLVATGAHVCLTSPAHAIADGDYTITSACNGKTLGLQNGAPDPGGNVVLRDAGSAGAINWTVNVTSDGSYVLRAAGTQSALQTSYERTASETNVDVWTYSGGGGQRWLIADGGNGTFKLSLAAAPAMSLDAKYGGGNGETEVWLYNENTTCAQRWNMQRAGVTAGNDLNAGATFQVSQRAGGKTVYVSPTGNDRNSGLTKSQAMATLNSAQYRAQPGDTIEIAGGEYAWVDGIWLNIAGSADNWIVIRAEEVNGQPANVLIKGDYRKRPPFDVACIGTASSYLEIRNLSCENFSATGFVSIGGHHLSLVGNSFRSLGGTGIGFFSDRGKGLQAYEIRAENNTVINTNREWFQRYSEGGWGQGISMFGDAITVRNNRVSQTRGEGIGITGVGNWVIGNTVTESCATGIYIDTGSRALMEQNFILQGKNAEAAAFFNTCQTTPYSNNRPLFGTGIQIAAETTTYTAQPQERLVGNVIRNNLIINGRVGLYYGNYGFDTGGGDGMRDAKIINNTFVGSIERVMQFDPGRRGANSGNVIANNIFYWTGATNNNPVLIRDATGLSFSNNLWQGLTAGPATGTGDVAGNPNFSNASGESPDDFRIGPTSPASGRGNSAYRPQVDFFGSSRSVKSPPDIGAVLAR